MTNLSQQLQVSYTENLKHIPRNDSHNVGGEVRKTKPQPRGIHYLHTHVIQAGTKNEHKLRTPEFLPSVSQDTQFYDEFFFVEHN